VLVCGGTVTGSTNGAPNTALAGTEPSGDHWYKLSLVAQEGTPVVLDLCNSLFDTVLTLWEGCPTGSGRILYFSDDSPECNDLTSKLTLDLSAGVHVLYALVEGYDSESGPYNLALSGCEDVCGDVRLRADPTWSYALRPTSRCTRPDAAARAAAAVSLESLALRSSPSAGFNIVRIRFAVTSDAAAVPHGVALRVAQNVHREQGVDAEGFVSTQVLELALADLALGQVNEVDVDVPVDYGLCGDGVVRVSLELLSASGTTFKGADDLCATGAGTWDNLEVTFARAHEGESLAEDLSVANDELARYSMSVTLASELGDWGAQSARGQLTRRQFRSAVGLALSLTSDRVDILAVRPGSVVVEFELASTRSGISSRRAAWTPPSPRQRASLSSLPRQWIASNASPQAPRRRARPRRTSAPTRRTRTEPTRRQSRASRGLVTWASPSEERCPLW